MESGRERFGEWDWNRKERGRDRESKELGEKGVRERMKERESGKEREGERWREREKERMKERESGKEREGERGRKIG